MGRVAGGGTAACIGTRARTFRRSRIMSVESIDAHQHFWDPSRGDYGWLTPELGGLYREFGPDDLKPLREAENVSRTVVVQAAQTVDETRYLLDLARNDSSIAGVVGWVPLDAP